jgi:hypothetical protein
MKNLIRSLLVFLFITCAFFHSNAQSNVGIGTATPSSKAALEIVSPGNNQGILIPRLSGAQRVAIGLTAAEKSLLVYDIDSAAYMYWNGSAWKLMLAGSNNGLTRTGSSVGLGGTLSSNTSIAMGGNSLTFTGGKLGIGTTGSEVFEVRGAGSTGTTLAMRLTNSAATTLFTVADDGMVTVSGAGKLGVGLSPSSKVDVLETSNAIYAVNSVNTYSGNFDSRAVRGYAVNNPGWGYGGEFTGGYRGISATAQAGAYSSSAYGVLGEAYGTDGTRIGVYGYASGGVTNYGIYGSYSGAAGYAGYFAGNVYCSGGSYLGSDEKLKENIKPYTGAIDMLRKMNVKTYKYRSDGIYKGMNFNKDVQYGFIAQEVEAVFPEFVKETSHVIHNKDKGKNGLGSDPEIVTFKSLNYNALIPILTQAIKEQQALIELQNEKINELDKRLEALEKSNK